MYRKVRYLLVVLFIYLTSPVPGQFSFSGEFRPRSEFSHGYKNPANSDQHPSLITSQRTRLVLDYQSEKLRTGLVLQDVRLWGNQAQLVENQDLATSVHQAWLEYRFFPSLSLKAGRQELDYDNSRIFGSVGWAQQGRSHDLLLLAYEGSFTLHTGLAFHQDSDITNNFYFGPDAYKSLQFLWAHKKVNRLSMSILLLNNGIASPRDTTGSGPITTQKTLYSMTAGPVLTYEADMYKAEAEAYYQGGKDGSDKDLSAWYLKLEATLKWSPLQLKTGYEYLSGTSHSEKETNRSFTPLYGTNHKFNGFMDYFYVGNHINNTGLQDAYIGTSASVGPVKITADFHGFLSAAEIASGASSYLGLEMDLGCTWKLDDQVSVGAGYSHMFPADGMHLLKGGSGETYHNWAWIMITVKPLFFKGT